MQTLSMRKMSLLGLVLLAASAVTAAVMPKDKTDKETLGYSLSASTGCSGQLTCSATNNADVNDECNYTGDSTLKSTVGNGTSLTSPGGAHTEPGGNTAATRNTSASPC